MRPIFLAAAPLLCALLWAPSALAGDGTGETAAASANAFDPRGADRREDEQIEFADAITSLQPGDHFDGWARENERADAMRKALGEIESAVDAYYVVSMGQEYSRPDYFDEELVRLKIDEMVGWWVEREMLDPDDHVVVYYDWGLERGAVHLGARWLALGPEWTHETVGESLRQTALYRDAPIDSERVGDGIVRFLEALDLRLAGAVADQGLDVDEPDSELERLTRLEEFLANLDELTETAESLGDGSAGVRAQIERRAERARDLAVLLGPNTALGEPGMSPGMQRVADELLGEMERFVESYRRAQKVLPEYRARLSERERRVNELSQDHSALLYRARAELAHCKKSMSSAAERLGQGMPRDKLEAGLEECIEDIDRELARVDDSLFVSGNVVPITLGLAGALIVGVWGFRRHRRWDSLEYELDHTLEAWEERIIDGEERWERLQEEFSQVFSPQSSSETEPIDPAVAEQVNLAHLLLTVARDRYEEAKLEREQSNVFFHENAQRARKRLLEDDVSISTSAAEDLLLPQSGEQKIVVSADELLDKMYRAVRDARQVLENRAA